MKKTITEHVKINATIAARAASTVDITGAFVDMKDFQSVAFICPFVSTAATQYLKVQGAASTTGGADLTGTKITLATAGDRVAVVEIHDSEYRYLRGKAFVGASVVGPEIVALQYNPRNFPVTQPINLASTWHASPTTGTA